MKVKPPLVSVGYLLRLQSVFDITVCTLYIVYHPNADDDENVNYPSWEPTRLPDEDDEQLLALPVNNNNNRCQEEASRLPKRQRLTI
jgi:hypothetical protein